MPEPPGKKPRQRRKRPLQPSMGPPPASPATDPDVQVPALPSSDAPCPIVGIGASAGGLEAFTQLLQQLPAETGLAFVLVQHLDPTHKSILTELLSRVSRIPVQQVQDGMAVEANRLYVVPPNVNMTIASRMLRLGPRTETIGLHMPIDHFFRSLARDQESQAMGLILSGTGSDGALGLAEIEVDIYREADRVILSQYAPVGVVINDQMDILQFRGDTSHYLRVAPERASFNLLRMAREGLLADLRAAIAQAKSTSDPVTREGARIHYEGRSLDVTLRVIPLTLPPPPASRFVVLFEEPASPAVRAVRPGTRRGAAAAREAERQRNTQLEQELEATKQYLQSIIEQHEAANEEVRHRNLELSQLNDDLNNLFGSVHLPIIMLGSDLRIRRFTPIAEKVLNIISTDVGRPIGHLQLNVRIPDLEPLILEAIDTVSPREREVQDQEGHWYSMRIRPYMTAEHKIDGAVLLFIDIDSLKDIDQLTRLLEEVKAAQNYAEGIVRNMPAPLLILDGQLRVLTANPVFYRLFQVSKEETEHQFIYNLGTGQWDISALRTLLENILPNNAQVDHFEVTYNFPEIGAKTMLLNARRIALEEHGTESILLAIEDITELKQAAEQLQASLSEKEVLLREIHHRVKNNLQIISSLLSLQSDKIQDRAVHRLFAESQRRVRSMALVHERLYTSMNLSSIDLGEYIEGLAAQLFQAYAASGNIGLDMQVDEVFVTIDTAIPCGLVLNELITNVLQHAFPAGQRGELSITLRAEPEGRVLLVVQDNGVGMPDDVDIARTDSLGLSLVHGLVLQLGGSLQLDCSGGTAISLRFSASLPRAT